MFDLRSLHSLLVEMHGGMLTLSTISILVIVIARLSRTREGSLIEKLTQYAEPTAILAGVGGVVGLVASSVVGFFVWPVQALTNSSLALTKVMFSIFAMQLWILFVAIRLKYGKALWQSGGLAKVYVCSGLVGFFFVTLSGCFGAYMSGKISILDPIYEFLGINPEAFWIIRVETVPILMGVAFVEIVAVFSAFLHFRWQTKS